MKVADLDASLSNRNRVPFRLSDSVRVPEIAGCYVLTNILGDVLYIGQSVNIQRRMEQHLVDARMTNSTRLGASSWFYWTSADDSELRSLEDQLLFRFKAGEGALPPLNRVGP